MKLYVGNLPYSVTENDLKELFSGYGNLGSVDLIIDKYSGQSKGFGFVEMPEDEEAEKAIQELNDKPFKGRPLRVNQAQERTERPPRRNSAPRR